MLKHDKLTHEEKKIICNKGTELPFSGKYTDLNTEGTYLCKQCGLALFRSQDKFHSGCGWPSFDNEITGAIKKQIDADGQRIEILCSRCSAHLGHVFHGEYFTAKNTRHCVNSISLDFVENKAIQDTEEAIFAAGCFWGVEYYFKMLPGVLKTEVGYTGGEVIHPTYEMVCQGNTGHVEAIRILYDPQKISYENLTKHFFEIHDPTQRNGQGPDLGQQYLSAIFYFNNEQQKTALQLIELLKNKKFDVATRVFPVKTFWHAEDYHQHYYEKSGKKPYCHFYVKKFD